MADGAGRLVAILYLMQHRDPDARSLEGANKHLLKIKRVTDFVDQWMLRKGIPEVRIDHRIERAEDGGYLLVVEAEQEAGSFMTMMRPVVFEVNGQRVVKLGVQEKPRQVLRFRVPARPLKGEIVPGGHDLARHR